MLEETVAPGKIKPVACVDQSASSAHMRCLPGIRAAAFCVQLKVFGRALDVLRAEAWHNKDTAFERLPHDWNLGVLFLYQHLLSGR